MGNIKELLNKYGFGTLILLIGIILLYAGSSGGQNNLVLISSATMIVASLLIILNNAGLISMELTKILVFFLIVSSLFFVWLNYNSVQEKLRFISEMQKRESKVVTRLMDIRTAEVSYKKLYGSFTDNFDALIQHVKNDSMPVVKAIGSVPDTLTEAKAVELGIVSRDTFKISVRDTLFPADFPIDSLRYVPNSGNQEFVLKAGEIEKNKLMVKVFEAFASYDKILYGMNLSEEYIDLSDGLRVGSMTDPHTRGNWE